MPQGSWDLGYTPGNTAVGRASFSPGDIADGLGDGGLGWMLEAMFSRAIRPEKKNWTRYDAEQAEYRARSREAAQRGRPDPNLRAKQAAEAERLRADIAQSRTAYMPAPTRTMSGFNVIPGPVLDPMRMTGAQRKAYLPEQASATGDVNEAGAGREWRNAPRPTNISTFPTSPSGNAPGQGAERTAAPSGQSIIGDPGPTLAQQQRGLNELNARMYPGQTLYNSMSDLEREADRRRREEANQAAQRGGMRRPDEYAYPPG